MGDDYKKKKITVKNVIKYHEKDTRVLSGAAARTGNLGK